MGDIKAIDKSTVHRICSGQVVLSLAVAVKELVENSLDAGATSVEVRLKEFGSESIEVADNGSGIHPDNFQGLTLKHHTSKIRDFSDLTSVETFGFRGEALSSLCALSEISVVTRHPSQECGTALVFDRNGVIVEEKRQARQVGTSVFVKNLFSTLPVRQKEFHKNLKREFHKMIQLLYAYCLVSTGVKLTCTNQTQKGARSTIMATQGGKTVRENISSLFGAKQLNSLLELRQSLPPDEELAELKASRSDCQMLQMEGIVSSCAHGAGRAAPSRQFYFINSRPCEPTKIMKQVNQVYHQFNKHQYPFVFLNLVLDRGSADVNVTPDKRQIFLIQEKLILAIIKASLLELYEKIPSSVVLNIASPSVSSNLKSHEQSVKPNLSRFEAWKHKSDMKRPLDSPSLDVPKKQVKIEVTAQKTLESFDIKLSRSVKCSSNPEEDSSSSSKPNSQETSSIQNTSSTESDNMEITSVQNSTSIDITGLSELSSSVHYDFSESKLQNSPNPCNSTISYETPTESCLDGKNCVDSGLSDLQYSSKTETVNDNSHAFSCENNESNLCGESEGIHNIISNDVSSISKSESFLDNGNAETSMSSENQPSSSCGLTEASTIVYDEPEERHCKTISWSVSLQQVKDRFFERISSERESKSKKTTLRFRADIDPSKNDEAEKELTREISKDMFEKMQIIGQFNLGFIITKLDSDLLIIDQHATDEKYNFETLQKTTTLNHQQLVVPQKLELAPEHESILLDNLETFHKNGFRFHIEEEAPPSQKVSLTSIPMSKNVVFGKEDIDEMIFMLQDSEGSMCRPSRVRAMFASRACRKSVMIGTALSQRQMRQLVTNMGTIEQPWNCPHGRPTIRHLLNLDLIVHHCE